MCDWFFLSKRHISQPIGKFTQGWADFEQKGRNVIEIMGISDSSQANAAPDVAFSIDTDVY
jgi:hypothetical protein